jgi:hypothetical protein
MKTNFIYLFIMILAVFSLSKTGYSQISFYAFSESTGNTFSSISATGTSVTLTDDSDILKPIGFSFTYNGTSYTQLNISSNGWVRLGTASASNGSSNIGNAVYPNAIALFYG